MAGEGVPTHRRRGQHTRATRLSNGARVFCRAGAVVQMSRKHPCMAFAAWASCLPQAEVRLLQRWIRHVARRILLGLFLAPFRLPKTVDAMNAIRAASNSSIPTIVLEELKQNGFPTQRLDEAQF